MLMFRSSLQNLVFKSTKTAFSFSRNLFEALNHIQASSLVPEEKTEAGGMTENAINLLECEDPHSRKREKSIEDTVPLIHWALVPPANPSFKILVGEKTKEGKMSSAINIENGCVSSLKIAVPVYH